MSETENEKAMDAPEVILSILEMFADRVESVSVEYALGDRTISYRVDVAGTETRQG